MPDYRAAQHPASHAHFDGDTPGNPNNGFALKADTEPAALVNSAQSKAPLITLTVLTMGFAFTRIICVTDVQKEKSVGTQHPLYLVHHIGQGVNIILHCF